MYGIYEDGNVIAQFVAPMTVRSNNPVFVSDTLSLSRKVAKRTAQRWELETAVEPLSTSSNDLFVNLVVNGNSDTVFVMMPQNIGAAHNTTSTAPAPMAVGYKGATTLTVLKNYGTIAKGQFIKFTGSKKVYMLTADLVNSGTMHIYPALRGDVDTTFEFKDIIMECLYDLDVVRGMSFSDGILMNMGTIKLVERL